jgi:hypothetical protein
LVNCLSPTIIIRDAASLRHWKEGTLHISGMARIEPTQPACKIRGMPSHDALKQDLLEINKQILALYLQRKTVMEKVDSFSYLGTVHWQNLVRVLVRW